MPTPNPMRTCLHCGSLQPASSQYCIRCGRSASGEVRQTAKPVQINPLDDPTIRKVLIGGAIGLVIIAGTVYTYLLWLLAFGVVIYYLATKETNVGSHNVPIPPQATVQIIPHKPEGYSASDAMFHLNYGKFPGLGTHLILVSNQMKLRGLTGRDVFTQPDLSLSVEIGYYFGKPSNRTGMQNLPPLPGSMNCLDYSNLLVLWLQDEIYSGTPIGPLKELSERLVYNNYHDTWRKLDIAINNSLAKRREDGMSFWKIENYVKCAQYFMYELTDHLSAYKHLDRLRMCYEKMGEKQKALDLLIAMAEGRTGVVPTQPQIETIQRSITRLQKAIAKRK